MKIAFYAPLKSPTHAVPSGDRRMARLLMAALEMAGGKPELAATLRSYEGAGDRARQDAIQRAGAAEAAALIERYSAASEAPDAWFTYHPYHKAPDWLGPAVSRALAIPYIIAEASIAPKQRAGPWAAGHAAVVAGVAAADAVVALSANDIECLRPVMREPGRLRLMTPFLDAAPYRAAHAARRAGRGRLAGELGLDVADPWLLTVAMMRTGDKLASYRRLGAALGRLDDLPWRLVVVGDGPARGAVEAALAGLGSARVAYAGARADDDLAAFYGAADIHVWPAVNEAYGMALLEAQAASLPVVAGRVRGVPEVVDDGNSGLLTPPGDDDAFAAAVRRLLGDPALRRRMAQAAGARVAARHGLAGAAALLGDVLTQAGA